MLLALLDDDEKVAGVKSSRPDGTPMHEVSVEHLIQTIRGRRVILDADLAALYGVTTKRLKEHVKRNPEIGAREVSSAERRQNGL